MVTTLNPDQVKADLRTTPIDALRKQYGMTRPAFLRFMKEQGIRSPRRPGQVINQPRDNFGHAGRMKGYWKGIGAWRIGE